VTAVESWLLVMGILAGLGAFLHLLPPAGAQRPWQVEAVARALVAASLVALAVALAIGPS
jgi:hypothetical protein